MLAVDLLTSPSPREGFHQLYQREFPFVFHTLRRLGVAPSSLEDFAHDVFAVVFRRWDTYDSARPLRPWLFGIAYRVVVDFKRKLENRLTTVTGALEQKASLGRSPEDELALQEAQVHVNAILGEMELGRRAVFIMHEIDGTSMPVIAETLELPLNTAYSRLRLARRDFNEAVRLLREASQ